MGMLLLLCSIYAQSTLVKGQLQDPDGEAVVFANVALYNSSDSSLVKVETTDEAGIFRIALTNGGTYDLSATYVGANDLWQRNLIVAKGDELDLGVVAFVNSGIDLAEATVTATRSLVEVKPDRTVFNVQGTINSTGASAIELLRRAPSVTVDNNDNINVLGRAGVLLYVDGKRLPLTGDALTNYLSSLPAEQIDRIDIITSPGAKYEAEGNAGIIDIRLKKNENYGANGSLNFTVSQGQLMRYNTGGSGNFRNSWMNTFLNVNYSDSETFNNMEFNSQQNGLQLSEMDRMNARRQNVDLRLGADFFLHKNHTVGFLVTGADFVGDNTGNNVLEISQLSAPSQIDSVLVANNTSSNTRQQYTANVNYRYQQGERSVNFDLDYGKYDTDSDSRQPNQYFDAAQENILTEIINTFATPSIIDIYTAKLDYEQPLFDGQFGAGAKLSNVISDNTFLVFEEINDQAVRDNRSSNVFDYDERVYAGYVSYTRPINDKWSFSAGLRAEKTDARGELMPFVDSLAQDPVVLDYLSWFPSGGLTWQVKPGHTMALNYGRRINRPDYNVLNPFNFQLSQLSFEKGNPFLRPEIVNNVELGYTLQYRYNFKLGYSRTLDQITRLIGPSEQDPRANFITWENLATQTTYSFNTSLPFQFTDFWSSFFNFSASYLDNQADYGEGAIVDVQAFTYSIYQQQSFKLPKGYRAEVSGYFAGPGVWGGVFRYESNWALGVGLQKKFFNDQLNVRLSADDLFYESGWDGVSEFNGLVSEGSGRWDSRRVAVSLSYNFGNQKVQSRSRKTGLEDEASRVNQ